MRVAEFAAAWGDLVPGGRSRETHAHNVHMVAPFVARFGRRELASVDIADALAFVKSHPSHARYARTLMEDARKGHFVDRNPFEGLRLPSSRGRANMDIFSELQAWNLVAAVDDVYDGLFALRFRALVATSLFSGIRACGASGLRPSAIVDHGPPARFYVDEKGGDDPKHRQVALAPPRARELFLEAVEESRGGLVFRSREGRALNRWSIGRAFRPVREEAGLPDITWHHLRHFCASWMIDRGVTPIDIAIQLHGRTDPDVVLRYYVHASRETAFERIAEVCA